MSAEEWDEVCDILRTNPDRLYPRTAGRPIGEPQMAMHDFYRSKKKPDERMATLAGAGLPDHADPNDWELMTLSPTSLELSFDVAEDIADHGFSYFKLV